MQINKNFILEWAESSAKTKNFREEFWLGITITAFVRFLAAAVSIYAGYFYFLNLLAPINLESRIIPILFSVLLLSVIEFFSAWILSKVTKASIEREYKRAAILAVFSVFTFGASFISSTNGLSMRQSQKADNTADIISASETEKTNIAARYDAVIADLKNNIETENRNPQGWRGNRRVYLTAQQLDRIKNINSEIKEQRELCNAEISEIKQSQSEKLSENRNQMTETADKYWLFIAIVMIISAVSNVALQAFYMKILAEEKKDLAAAGVMTRHQRNQENMVNREFNRMLEIQAEEQARLFILSNNKDAANQKGIAAQNDEKNIGFRKSEKEDRNNYPLSDDEKSKVIYLEVEKNNKNVCQNCGKSYTPKVTWQKWCSDECKFDNYEKRTGKKFNMRKHK